MKKIVSLGEVLMRLSPPGYERFLQAQSFDINYGGAEANVSLALSNLGYDSYFITKLPDNPIGQAAVNHLRQYGVNINNVIFGGDRIGVYYMEKGSSFRASNVIYDRANSSLAQASSDEFDFDSILKDADVFFVTGITPAISKNSAIITKKALEIAKNNNVMIIMDVNYRSKLWSLEEANEVMKDLLPFADVVLGFTPDILLGIDQNLNPNEHIKLFSKMIERYDLKYAASTFRTSPSANYNKIYARLYDGKNLYTSKEYEFEIVDRVGGGDSFATGLISGILDGKNPNDCLEFATASSVWKHTIPGDSNIASKKEIENLANGGSTLVRR